MHQAQRFEDRIEKITLEFKPVDPKQLCFDRSIALLLSLALRQTQAEAAFIHNYSSATKTLSPFTLDGLHGRGLEPASMELDEATTKWFLQLELPYLVDSHPECDEHIGRFPELRLNKFNSFATVPLRNESGLIGLLNLGWRDTWSAGKRIDETIRLIASALTALLTRSSEMSSSLDLASRIVKLQAELADYKIAERLKGLLVGADARDAALAVGRHVNSVLSSMDLEATLREELKRLELNLHDRRLVAKAKTVLQAKLALSEEQAYMQLRNASRRTRRPLREIAGEVLQHASQPTLARIAMNDSAAPHQFNE